MVLLCAASGGLLTAPEPIDAGTGFPAGFTKDPLMHLPMGKYTIRCRNKNCELDMVMKQVTNALNPASTSNASDIAAVRNGGCSFKLRLLTRLRT